MASRSVNKVILLGHLGKDAETRFTPSGAAVTNFTLATNRRWKDQQTGDWKEETDWHNIVVWKAENLAPHLQKGKQVYVEGRLQTRQWEGQDGQKRYTTELVANTIQNLERRPRDDSGGDQSEPYQRPRPAAAPAGRSAGPAETPAETEYDDLPF